MHKPAFHTLSHSSSSSSSSSSSNMTCWTALLLSPAVAVLQLRGSRLASIFECCAWHNCHGRRAIVQRLQATALLLPAPAAVIPSAWPLLLLNVATAAAPATASPCVPAAVLTAPAAVLTAPAAVLTAPAAAGTCCRHLLLLLLLPPSPRTSVSARTSVPQATL
jgi:hypothetical protein